MPESTEKLLNIIRQSDQTAFPPTKDLSSVESAPATPRKRARRKTVLPWARRHRRLGVDISPRGLHLMLVTDSGSIPRILGFRDVSYPRQSEPGSSAFPSFLRREVQSLCGRLDDLLIWSHVFSAKSQLQHVLVPKVPLWELYDLVYWRVKKDNPFDEKEFLLDLEVQGQVMDKGTAKLSVLCCLVPRMELAQARSYFVQAGLPLAGMTVASLALQTLFRTSIMPVESPSFSTLHIGREWSRIDIFSENNLVLSRVVKTGLNSMAETLVQEYADKIVQSPQEASQAEPGREGLSMPEVEVEIALDDSALDNPESQEALQAPVSGPGHVPGNADLEPSIEQQPRDDSDSTASHTARSAPENNGDSLDREHGLDMLITALSGSTDNTSPPGLGLSGDQVFELVTPVCERLSRQVERTFDYNIREQQQERTNLLLLSGDISVNARLQRHFQDILGVKTLVLDPLDPELSSLGRALKPSTPRGRVRQSLALGLALSDDKHCLNLQRTFQQREEARSVSRVNIAMYAVTIVILLLLSLTYGLQGREMQNRSETLAELDYELASFIPRLSGEMLMQAATQVKERQEELRALSDRLEVLAMLREVSALTPEHIRLFNIRIDAGSRAEPGARGGPRAAETARSKSLVMDGMIVGDPMGFETALAGYIIGLQRSPLFDVPQVHDKRMETGPNGEERMRFVLHVPVNKTLGVASLDPRHADWPGYDDRLMYAHSSVAGRG